MKAFEPFPHFIEDRRFEGISACWHGSFNSSELLSQNLIKMANKGFEGPFPGTGNFLVSGIDNGLGLGWIAQK